MELNLETPALLLDEARMQHNMARMQERSEERRVGKECPV